LGSYVVARRKEGGCNEGIKGMGWGKRKMGFRQHVLRIEE